MMSSGAATDGHWPAVGVGLPIGGPHAGPAAVEAVATTADGLGFSSVSVSERLLLPAGPDWSNDFGLPDWPFYDAIESLTWVAAKTSGIRLRTDVVVPLFQQPIVLARRLATLDHLSGGRVEAGDRARLASQGVQGDRHRHDRAGRPLRGVCGRDAGVLGARPRRVPRRALPHPRSKIGPKPLKGTIPVFIGAVAQPAVERAARLGDGFTLGFRNWDDALAQIEWYRAAGGTGPIVVRGGPMLADAEHATPPPRGPSPRSSTTSSGHARSASTSSSGTSTSSATSRPARSRPSRPWPHGSG